MLTPICMSYITSKSNSVLFVNVVGITKLYNLSGAGLKKLIPLSYLIVFATVLAYVLTAPAKVVVFVAT
jgi:hypothetical protein